MTRVTQAEFARMAGVNRSTVHRWIQNGRIEADAHGLIDPDAAARMRDATESPLPHHQARKAQFDEAREGVGQGGAEKTQQAGQEAQQPATHGLQKPADVYMARKAEKIALEIDKMAGALVERADVDFVLADFGNTLRALLESLPDRVSPSVARHRGDVVAIHAELSGVAADLLNEISEHMKRKMEEMQ